MTENYQTVGL